MDKTLKSNIHKYNKQVDFYLQLPQILSSQQLSFKYNEHEWSLLELLEHTFQVEVAALNFMKNFDFGRKNQRLGFRENLNYYLLKISLLSPLDFKIPPVKALNPEHKHIDSELLNKEWLAHREELNHFADSFPLEKRYHFIFNHPRAGKLNIAQVFGFLNDHAQHHRRQVKKIKSFKGFPEN